eukprot:2992330-Pleurochrysis_carterae.AAC.2
MFAVCRGAAVRRLVGAKDPSARQVLHFLLDENAKRFVGIAGAARWITKKKRWPRPDEDGDMRHPGLQGRL